MQYCLERLHSGKWQMNCALRWHAMNMFATSLGAIIGFWLSPAEQLSVERQRGRLPLHGWPVLPGTGQTRPSGAPALTSDAFGMHLGELAPLDDFNYPGSDLPKLVPQTLLSEVERYWPRALKEHFSFPFANIVVDLRENNSGLEIAADMDVKGVLLQCQRAHMWARPYARRPAPRKRSIRVLSPGKKAARSSESGEAPSSPPFSLVPPKPVDLPLTPDDSADIGLRTAEDMMELWKQSWGPLEECNCGICARGKRMREDANREYPDKFARI